MIEFANGSLFTGIVDVQRHEDSGDLERIDSDINDNFMHLDLSWIDEENNIANGDCFGEFVHVKGDRYFGFMKDTGEANGQGVFLTLNNKNYIPGHSNIIGKVVGSWRDGMKHGLSCQLERPKHPSRPNSRPPSAHSHSTNNEQANCSNIEEGSPVYIAFIR